MNVFMPLIQRKNAVRVLEAAIFLFFIAGCSVKTVDEQNDILVCSSVFPISQIAQSVLGDSGVAFNLVPPGANPHVFEPAPSDARKLAEADIILCVSPELDGWMEKFAGSETKVLYLDKYFSEKNMEPGDNPHIWLSLKYALLIASAVRETAVEIKPDRREYYEDNFRDFEREISSLDSFASEKFSGLKEVYFIQWHPAWNYLANDYGLPEPMSIESGHGDEPTAAELKKIIDFAEENSVRVIVVEANSDMRQAEIIAGQINANIAVLDPVGDPDNPEISTYILNMKKNIITLAEAMEIE